VLEPPDVAKRAPTAKQLDALTHETPTSWVASPAAAGPGVIVHVVPFQRSSRARELPEPFTNAPTAKQLVALEHDTSNRCGLDGPGGLGLVTMVQAEPVHTSMSVG